VPLTSIAIRAPSSRRARVVLGTALVCTGLAVGAAGAQARAQLRTVTVCATQATLYETPGGAKVGILHRGDRVRVLAKGTDDPWWRVAARFGTRGWVRTSAICGHHR
jgi:hypothetical protein